MPDELSASNLDAGDAQGVRRCARLLHPSRRHKAARRLAAVAHDTMATGRRPDPADALQLSQGVNSGRRCLDRW